MKTRGEVILAAALMAVAILTVAWFGRGLAAPPDRRSADQPRNDSTLVRAYADLNRLSDLVLQLDELRADGADEMILADARAKIAAELRLDPSEEEPLPNQPERGPDSTAQRQGQVEAQRFSQRVRSRAAQIQARERVLIGDLRLLQLRIDAGTDDTPALEADQDTMLNEYLALTREEIRLGLREAGES